jgi:sigma-B regulation protein RsbU (phosphoserine phosphatase)
LLITELAAVASTEHTLAPGDRLLFFTDGVTDRESSAGEIYDLERLSRALAHGGAQRVDAALESLVADLESFAEGCEPGDDNTLLLLGVDDG